MTLFTVNRGSLFAVLMILLAVPPAFAEEEAKTITPATSPSGEEDSLQEEIVIRKSGENVIEEHRINGRLYKVKVTPAIGPAYYLIDTDGDGFMDSRHGGETGR